MFKKLVFMLAIAALFTTCEEVVPEEIPDLTGYWIHSRSDFVISLNGAVIMDSIITYTTSDPLNYDFVLHIDADSVYFCENDPYTTGYTCETETFYDQLTDSTMLVDDDNGIPEEVAYSATDNTFIIVFDGEEEMDGTIYDRHSVETFVRYSGTFPPAAWTTAQDDPAAELLGYWLMATNSWIEYEDGLEVDSGTEIGNTTDPYEWKEVIHITADSIIFCENDPYSTEYNCESDGAYYVEGDTIYQTMYDDKSGTYHEEAIPFTIVDNSFSVSFDEVYDDAGGVIKSRHNEITMVRYTGTFPPTEWTTALTNPVLGRWLFVSESWSETADGTLVDSGTDEREPGDSYLEDSIIEFTAEDSIVFCGNDLGSSSYNCETDYYRVEGDTLYMTDEGSEYGIPFTISGGNMMLTLHDEYEDAGVTYIYHSEVVLMPYTGVFPPTEWLTPIPNDTYEPDDTYTDATTIAVGTVDQEHVLLDADQDWFKFDAVAGSRYAFERTSQMDIQLELWADPGNNIREPDPDWISFEGETERNEWTCTTAGTYYFVIYAWTDANEQPVGDTGYYTISLITAASTSPGRAVLSRTSERKTQSRKGFFHR